MNESQKKAIKKYKKKLNRLTLDFSPAESEMWEHINKQPKKQTYIKDLIRKDMRKSQMEERYKGAEKTVAEALKHIAIRQNEEEIKRLKEDLEKMK